MAKSCALSVMYPYSWKEVVTCFWSKYPNSYSSHVLSEDVIEKEIIDGCLYTKRLLVKTNSMPRWGEFFYRGPKHVYIIEEALVDPKTRTLTTHRRNVNLKGFMEVEERNVFTPNADSADTTNVHKQAWISCPMRGISYAAQKFGVERYKYNSVKSDKGFLEVLLRMCGSLSSNQMNYPDVSMSAHPQAPITSALIPVAVASPAGSLHERLKANAGRVRNRSDVLMQKASGHLKELNHSRCEVTRHFKDTAYERSPEFLKERARKAAEREKSTLTETFRKKADEFRERSRAKGAAMKEKARLARESQKHIMGRKCDM